MQIHVNGQTTEVHPSCTVNELVSQLDLTGKRIAIERNGEIVPKSQYANAALNEGDQLEIVVAVGGG